MERRDTVVVLGEDEFGLERLDRDREGRPWTIHPIFRFEDLQSRSGYPIEQLLERAAEQLDPLAHRIAGITGYWDFPVTSMIPILCRRYGVNGPSLESVLRCEHKYWARVCQREAIPDAIPDFRAVDPFDDDLIDDWDLGYPFWLKPVKAWSSQLGFLIEDEAAFRAALEKIRKRIDRFAEPFNHVLHRAELPRDIAVVDGYHCIAEALIDGEQCTLEGFVSEGRARTYAIIDSYRYEGLSSFARYQYPSRLPREAKLQMVEMAERLMEAIGYDQAAFNIEFFWDDDTEQARVLEVNPRLSLSHADITLKVDGVSNLEKMAALAAGETPMLHKEAGRFPVAAKFIHRRFEDAFVERVPAPEEVEQIERDVPGVTIQITAQAGERLSDLLNQDSYSYELALIHVGGEDEDDLESRYETCVDRLEFRFS